MNDSSHTQASFGEEQKVLINQIRAETRAELEASPVKALHLSPATLAFLHRAGFRTIRHILHPTPEQLNQAKDITSETKQEIRENLLWAIRQWKRYFWRRIDQILPNQSSSSIAETTHTISPTQPEELTSQINLLQNDQTDYPIADDVYVLLFPLEMGEESYTHIRIEAMKLSGRTYNALMRSHITTVGELVPLTPEQLLQIDGIGSSSEAEIKTEIYRYTKNRPERGISEPLLGELTSVRSLANRSLEVLDLPKRTRRLLNLSAISTVGQLAALTKPQLEKLAGASYLSNKAVEEILEKLAAYLDFSSHESEETEHPLNHWQPTEPEPERDEFPTDNLETEPSLPEPDVVSPDFDQGAFSVPDIDNPLEQMGLFSTRVNNALVRRGIITLRLLLIHTPEMLRQHIKNLGNKGLAEIEETVAQFGWALAETGDVKRIALTRLLAAAFYKVDDPMSLADLTAAVNRYSQPIIWDEASVAEGAANHPYIVVMADGRYLFSIHPVNMPLEFSAETVPDLSVLQADLETGDGKLLLAKVWLNWIAELTQRQLEILFLHYGVLGDEPLTLEETGHQLGLTRERVRQIETKALARLAATGQRPYYQPLYQLLAEGIQQADGLLTSGQWERLLDETTVWEEEQARPWLLPFLCAVSEDYHYHNSYQVATQETIKNEHLKQLDAVFKRILRPHTSSGLTAEQLIAATQQRMGNNFPTEMQEPVFILAAVELFEKIEMGVDGRYLYLRKEKKPLHPRADSGWGGRPGSRLHEWELRLRPQFEKAAWIGQLAVTEADFAELCQMIQAEAQEPNIFTRVLEGQPRLVPPAVFMTTLVFAARYSQQNADEFWVPYLRTVWNVEYTQTFMARCRKRFIEAVPYLEQAFDFDFPRQSEGDLVAAVYRHALLPRYVQDDLARWLREQWRAILQLADAPDLLIAELRQDKKLDYLPQRLQKFIRSKDTEATAVALISNMAAAISLYVNEGETIENISTLLTDIPIEQELWREVAQVFADAGQNLPVSLRQTKPRITWVWDMANEEMALRVQNIILPADSDLEGEPDRLVWLESANADPLAAEIEVEISPWRMHTGERVINDVFLAEPDGPLAGQLLLLTDMDEEAARLDVPPLPASAVQFFRLTQQGAYGIPVEPSQVTDGVWLVCAARPLTFLDEDEVEIEPDEVLDVPYPLAEHYHWAAQLTLTLPVTVKDAASPLKLTMGSSTALTGRPFLTGAQQIAGLSRQVQPTFADTQVSLVLAQVGERLLKQASLWLRGQSGWRWQRPLAELLTPGIAEWDGTTLHIHLQHVIPSQPDFYLVELRASLQPLLPAPLQFAVVPGLEVISPSDDQLYTTANPPQLVLQGVDESVLVRRNGLQVEKLPDGRHLITWHDLRHEPRLTLRFDKVDIPLAWSPPYFMAWIEPKPAKPFLTLAELQESVLHAAGTKTAVSEFRLFIPGQRYRPFSLRNGRYTAPIGQSQLYDMVKLAQEQPVQVNVQVNNQTWMLLEVRRRPQLTAVRLEYDDRKRVVRLYTGLEEAWKGDGRFMVESLTNPFAPPVELWRTDCLQERHLLPVDKLPQDVYLLRLELDGVAISLDENAMRFTVGPPIKLRAKTGPLVQEIRGGQLIPAHQAEDFVLLWAENAEKGTAELTATTLYQLATVSATALENFDFPHLCKLWPPLEKLKAVHDQSQWVANHGYLPAWILLDQPLILRTAGQGYQLRVYPVQTAYGGREGRGYGHWHMSTVEGAPKEPVLVQWRAITDTQVQVEAGLIPEEAAIDWTTIDLLDTYALWHCARCGRLVGAKTKTYTLPDELQREHLHGHPQPLLRDITLVESLGGYQLLAELLPERRGPWLMGAYADLGLHVHSAATYLPEPAVIGSLSFEDAKRVQLLAILRETKRFGTENTNQPYWASASRLLGDWRHQHSVGQFGQGVFALSALLRMAARRPKQFHRLLKEASLSEKDVQELLAELNQTAPDHVQWGLTWAELLMVHSSSLSNRAGGSQA